MGPLGFPRLLVPMKKHELSRDASLSGATLLGSYRVPALIHAHSRIDRTSIPGSDVQARLSCSVFAYPARRDPSREVRRGSRPGFGCGHNSQAAHACWHQTCARRRAGPGDLMPPGRQTLCAEAVFSLCSLPRAGRAGALSGQACRGRPQNGRLGSHASQKWRRSEPNLAGGLDRLCSRPPSARAEGY